MIMNDQGYFPLEKEDFFRLDRGQEVFLDLRDPDSGRKICIHALAVEFVYRKGEKKSSMTHRL